MSQLTLLGIEPATSEPIFAWPGGKRRLLGAIMPHLPQGAGARLVSPFIGGGAVEMAVAATGASVVAGDANPALAEIWRMLLTEPDRFAYRLRRMREGGVTEEEMREAIRMEGKDLTGQATALFLRIRGGVLMNLPHGQTLMKKPLPRGGYDESWRMAFSTRAERAVEGFRAPGLEVMHADYRDTLAAEPDAFAYLDPPYWEEGEKAYTSLYTAAKGFEHNEFAAVVKARRSRWLLSINDCEWARQAFAGHRMERIAVKWMLGATEGNSRGARGELLIFGG